MLLRDTGLACAAEAVAAVAAAAGVKDVARWSGAGWQYQNPC